MDYDLKKFETNVGDTIKTDQEKTDAGIIKTISNESEGDQDMLKKLEIKVR